MCTFCGACQHLFSFEMTLESIISPMSQMCVNGHSHKLHKEKLLHSPPRIHSHLVSQFLPLFQLFLQFVFCLNTGWDVPVYV